MKREGRIILSGTKKLFEQGKEIFDPLNLAPRNSMSYRERRYLKTVFSDFALGMLWVPVFMILPGSPFIFLGMSKYFPSALPKTFSTARYLLSEVPTEADLARCCKVLNIQREFIPGEPSLQEDQSCFDGLENQTLVTLILRVRENYDAAIALSRSHSVSSHPGDHTIPLDNILIGGKRRHFLKTTDDLKTTPPDEILNMPPSLRSELIDLLVFFCASLSRDNNRVRIEYIHRTGLFELTDEDERLSETLMRFAPFLSKKTLFDTTKTSSFYFRNDPQSQCEVHSFLLQRLLLAPTDIDPRLWQYRAKEERKKVPLPRLVPEIDTMHAAAPEPAMDGVVNTMKVAETTVTEGGTVHIIARNDAAQKQPLQPKERISLHATISASVDTSSSSPNKTSPNGNGNGRNNNQDGIEAESGSFSAKNTNSDEGVKPPAQTVKPVSYADSLLWKEHVDKIEAYSFVRAYLKLTQVYSTSQLLVATSLSKDLHLSR